MQTIHETVTLANHDFLIGAHQKLIPSVYLVIDLSDSNDTLRKGYTSSNTHIADLIKLTNQESFTNIFKNNNQVKPIWVLLIDERPDKNPRHLKNICRYCKLFQFLDFDYLILERHTRICQYSLNIQKYNDLTCCHPKRHKESAAFLAENDEFLLLVSKSQNRYYLNPVHIL
ncbi:5930_t:CDS:2 [Scutellospora calospora]|uniref:5930_t:CDS:1 n=1 Tax=Scutellospora calospora TaxID=85575 RepID=A0ACA9KBG4_9GLOM|nr:5930_t:CDS:2 [Scutellospora calospora]